MELHLETNDTSLELLLPRIKEHTDAKKILFSKFCPPKKCGNEESSAVFMKNFTKKKKKLQVLSQKFFASVLLHFSLLLPLRQIFMIFLRLLSWPSRSYIYHSAVLLLFLVKIGREKNKETFTQEAKSKDY